MKSRDMCAANELDLLTRLNQWLNSPETQAVQTNKPLCLRL